MSKIFRQTSMRRTLPIVILAILACLLWGTVADAQTPFDAQYDPPTQMSDPSTQMNDPPTDPPYDPPGENSSPGSGGSGSAGDFDPGVSGSSEGYEGAGGETSDPNWGSDPQAPSLNEGTVDVLPTTGGLLAAPILLGMAMIVAAGIFTIRRKR